MSKSAKRLDQAHHDNMAEEVAQVKDRILETLAAQRAAGTPVDERVELAKAGILHLLAVREMRLRRYNEIARLDPNHRFVRDTWADETMVSEKIMYRLCAPRIKAYLLDPSLPRNDEEMVDNPYAQEHMSSHEVIEAMAAVRSGNEARHPVVDACMRALQELVDEHSITDPNTTHLTRYVKSEAGQGAHYRINDRGLSLTPYYGMPVISPSLKSMLENTPSMRVNKR